MLDSTVYTSICHVMTICLCRVHDAVRVTMTCLASQVWQTRC